MGKQRFSIVYLCILKVYQNNFAFQNIFELVYIKYEFCIEVFLTTNVGMLNVILVFSSLLRFEPWTLTSTHLIL